MSYGRRGMTYRKSQRYDPNEPKREYNTYRCEECGAELEDVTARIDLASGGSEQLCPDCATKVINNKFYSLKDKKPDDVLDDFNEL